MIRKDINFFLSIYFFSLSRMSKSTFTFKHTHTFILIYLESKTFYQKTKNLKTTIHAKTNNFFFLTSSTLPPTKTSS